MRSRFVVLPLLALAFAAGHIACGAGPEIDAATDAGPNQPDSGTFLSDGATPASLQKSIVFVNAVTAGPLVDVRLCASNAKGVAVPNDHPMALTNFPGIARGRGIDLGAFDASGGIDVFAADAIRDQISTTCGSLRQPGTKYPSTHLGAPVINGPTALVLVTDGTGALALRSIALSKGAEPTVGQIAVQFASASLPSAVTMTFEGGEAHSGTESASVGFLVPKSFEAELSLNDGAKFTYTQSLRSIQHVSDPTTDPATFFDSRTQFLFVLVGDPLDPYGAYESADQLTGKELHVAAIPFSVSSGQ
ncbi:hypothetical protein BH09MYX1_BH09MYX1_39020 [soil metagenome]